MPEYSRIKLYTDRDKVVEADVIQKSDNQLRVAIAGTTVPLTLRRSDVKKPYTAMIGNTEVRTKDM